MTPAEIKALRQSLGLSAAAFGRLLGVSGERTVFRWEAGDIVPPGPVALLLDLLREKPYVVLWLRARATLATAATDLLPTAAALDQD